MRKNAAIWIGMIIIGIMLLTVSPGLCGWFSSDFVERKIDFKKHGERVVSFEEKLLDEIEFKSVGTLWDHGVKGIKFEGLTFIVKKRDRSPVKFAVKYINRDGVTIYRTDHLVRGKEDEKIEVISSYDELDFFSIRIETE